MSSSDEAARKAFGEAVKGIRKKRGVTQEVFGEKLGMSQSLVSKLESGRASIGCDIVDAIDEAFGLAVDELELLKKCLELSDLSLLSYRAIEPWGFGRYQGNIEKVEDAAQTIDIYECCQIPGLLQTANYTRRMAEYMGICGSERELFVQGRRRRQRFVLDGNKKLTFILLEQALYSESVFCDLMHEQIVKLIGLAGCVSIGVLPMRAGCVPKAASGFIIYHSRNGCFVTAETVACEERYADEGDVRYFIAAFEELRERAVFGDECLELLDRALSRV